MKANELSGKDLMIGDYVYGCIETDIVSEATYRILCKVKEINEDIVLQCIEPLPDELDWQDGDDFSWIEPISLTPEILEKNGFVNVENTQTSTIIYSFRDSLFRIGVFDFNHIIMDSYYTDSSCDIFISSIHELQHALRLCGINHEIIL